MIPEDNPGYAGQFLSKRHRQMLAGESGITSDVIAERGYRTIRSRAELLEFKKYQRRAPALYIPMHSPCARTMPQIRADNPRKTKSGDVIRYETPGGAEPIIDVHPRNHTALKDVARRLWITEGVKKGDALTSAGEVAVALAGVWMFGAKELFPAWNQIDLEGRDVLVVYDSDIMHKSEVAQALERLAGLLVERGATVSSVYLKGGPDGEKVGVDDYLVAGGTVDEMVAKAVPYDPADFEYLRIERNQPLKEALADARRIYSEMPARTQGQNTRRSVMRAVIRRCAKYGRRVKDGISVPAPSRSIAMEARIGQATAVRALAALVSEDVLQLERKPKGKKAGRYILLLPDPRISDSLREGGRGRETSFKGQPNNVSFAGGPSLNEPVMRAPEGVSVKDEFCGTYDPCESLLRGVDAVPELRWSSPGRKPTKAQIRASRTGESQVPLPRVRERTRRLGKKRAAMLEYVLDAGGSCSVVDLMSRFASEKARPRDFVRRQLGPMVAEALLEVSEGTVTVDVGWEEALENARVLGLEAEADDLQREKIKRQRRAYHSDVEVDPSPPEGRLFGLERIQAARARREERMRGQVRDAFCDPNGGPMRNLALLMDGEMINLEALVKSVLHYLRIPFNQWDHWRDPVQHVAADIVRKHIPGSRTGPPEPPTDGWRSHPLSCECEDCLCPEPTYAGSGVAP